MTFPAGFILRVLKRYANFLRSGFRIASLNQFHMATPGTMAILTLTSPHECLQKLLGVIRSKLLVYKPTLEPNIFFRIPARHMTRQALGIKVASNPMQTLVSVPLMNRIKTFERMSVRRIFPDFERLRMTLSTF
jgi:hypothetical protein